MLIPPQENFPLQGSCVKLDGTDPKRDIDLANSTFSCPGNAVEPLHFSYAQGGGESCLYIDNISAAGRSYFVPLRSAVEWQKFKASVQTGGDLSGEISLNYGCPASSLTDSCGTVYALPEARNGKTTTIENDHGRKVSFLCIASSGCGAWSITSQTGPCPVNGSCGSAHDVPVATAPAIGFCLTGTVTPLTGTGPWDWMCKGSNGGTDAMCSAPIIGTCGPSHGGTFTTAPASGLCATGTATALGGTGPWTWDCLDSRGTVSSSCSANINHGCTLPWGGTISDGQSVTAYKENSVACDKTCESETRTCSGGTLSGSFTHNSCSIKACLPCGAKTVWMSLGGSLWDFYGYGIMSLPNAAHGSISRTCTWYPPGIGNPGWILPDPGCGYMASWGLSGPIPGVAHGYGMALMCDNGNFKSVMTDTYQFLLGLSVICAPDQMGIANCVMPEIGLGVSLHGF